MRNWLTLCFIFVAWAVARPSTFGAISENEIRSIGVAKVDITPNYPVRLSGYGNRRDEFEAVEQRLWAKALAIGSLGDEPTILITVDNCGIPDAMRSEVEVRLAKKAGIRSERLAICFSHTHCAPCLTGALVNIFSSDIPKEHQAQIDRYSQELTDHLEQVALAALADRQPGFLSWSIGEVRFARNRRLAWGGPVDHGLPVMFVHSLEGKLRAVLANYACHATTLNFNRIHGDWPGTAMEAIEREQTGAIAMISIGCGADQNPNPRGTVELAVKHGAEVAAEVSRLLKADRTPIRGPIAAREKNIVLPLVELPTREEWDKLAVSASHQVAYAAKKNLARLDRGQILPVELPYRVQVWNFGNDLAMVFLPGEVTIDYQLRLKVEFDPSRLWVNAYSNDAPCYIPSARVLAEGGYEGATAMIYYDRPARFASGIEERIVEAVHELTADGFLRYRTEVPPRSPVELSTSMQDFIDQHCIECHDSGVKKGNLDLDSLPMALEDPENAALWIQIHDRVEKNEMPPRPSQAQPSLDQRLAFLRELSRPLIAVDDARILREGRSTWRRMNRYEYENTLRDLFQAPWLQIKEMLPEDGEANRFNKSGDALDVSHVQIARYLNAAEYALREVLAAQALPKPTVTRYYAREQPGFARRVQFSQFNRSPERATFPIIDNAADVPVLENKAPMTVGPDDPRKRDLESMGVVASTYEPLEIKFDGFSAPASGRYRLSICAHSFWAAPESQEKWWRPSRTEISAGRTREPVSIYAETPPRLLRKLGSFDLGPEPSVSMLDVYLLKGETIRPDAVRLFRSRPPGGWHNPLAQRDGQPGVTFRWLEVQGPFAEAALDANRQLLFSDLPMFASPDGSALVDSPNPKEDSKRLLQHFMQRAYGRPPEPPDSLRFLQVIHSALDSGSHFAEAMLTGYAAVLCSPEFVTLEEMPGKLDDVALAARLSYFLWNSEPDDGLRKLAAEGRLQASNGLRRQTERMLADPKVDRFVEAFLDYWLDLRKANATSPDAELYPDYYLDDFLIESASDETRAFFKQLIATNAPAREIIDTDYAIVNERLAQHYGLPEVSGVAMRRVGLPEDSPRGGLLTQASILKVTANGTTTSPVLRGVWIMERILGEKVPPPPAAVPAVEPDTRGTTTIRQQLDKHRTQAVCNSCHSKIDPAGFALENFDVVGGWRERYRALSGTVPANPARFGKNGQPFAFEDGPLVDASGELPNGEPFDNIRDLKRLLLEDERQIARNLAKQLIVYATGAPVGFGDRPELEEILDLAEPSSYGVKSLMVEIIQSPLFRQK